MYTVNLFLKMPLFNLENGYKTMVNKQYMYSCSCFFLGFFLSLSSNYFKKNKWLVIKSGA